MEWTIPRDLKEATSRALFRKLQKYYLIYNPNTQCIVKLVALILIVWLVD